MIQSVDLKARRLRVPFLSLLMGVGVISLLALTGCGGGSSNNDAARIRSVDAATNAGTANILVNNSSAYGDQTDFSESPYLYIATGTSTFSYTSSAASSSLAELTSSANLASNQYYSVFLIGRADLTSTTDARYLRTIITDDSKPAVASGEALVRVVHAAADSGPIDVLVNGSAPDTTFQDVKYVTPISTFYVAGYIPVPAGNISVQVNETGTTTEIIPPTTVSVPAGSATTLVVTEPAGGTAALGTANGTPPTFKLQTTRE